MVLKEIIMKNKDFTLLEKITVLLQRKTGKKIILNIDLASRVVVTDYSAKAVAVIQGEQSYLDINDALLLIFADDGSAIRCKWRKYLYEPDFLEEAQKFIIHCSMADCGNCEYRGE